MALSKPLSNATLSPCRTYRYSLHRLWKLNAGNLLVIGLNPSTADENTDDPTVRRCIGFARSWGFGSLTMANLFAYRSTNPEGLRVPEDPVGPENDWWLVHLARASACVVCAWGAVGALNGRSTDVRALFRTELPELTLCHLGLTKSGQPRHPLYLRRDLRPQPWTKA
tara:strand:+ start:3067 stop:3570 length:504 start_codon:yes stop_codon:yes gene_type:complete